MFVVSHSRHKVQFVGVYAGGACTLKNKANAQYDPSGAVLLENSRLPYNLKVT